MAQHDEGFFNAKDNLRLFWESDLPDRPKAHLGIVHGYADHSGRYRKFIDALVADGFAVHAFDYRGHGQADGRRGYCEKFSEFIDDLDAFWSRIRASARSERAFLIAHSHGGLMAIHYQARNPPGLAGLVLSAPYLRLAFKAPPLKVFAAKAIEKVIPWLPIKNELVPEMLTRDPEAQKAVERDHLYNRSVTPRWFSESNAAQWQAREMAPKIQLPIYVVCGAEDPVASTPTTREFFERIGSADKQYQEYPGMRHEVLNEVGKEVVWKDISRWISKHL
ncbi:MAG TPA: alpha/beta hydrolase [Myxococcaceae bacterium]|nr:alpha/beta hydrolase [Myxococcaceae bacterium]